MESRVDSRRGSDRHHPDPLACPLSSCTTVTSLSISSCLPFHCQPQFPFSSFYLPLLSSFFLFFFLTALLALCLGVSCPHWAS